MAKSEQIFDAIVVGAGIAGSTASYFLADRGLSVAVVEKHKIASGASGAAGAFLSPMMGKQSVQMSFVNSSLASTLDLYERIAPDLLVRNGQIRYPKNGEKFWEYLPFLDIDHGVEKDHIFFPNAGVVCAEALCKRLLAKATVFENYEAKNPHFDGEFWQIGDLKATNLIIASGAYEPIIPSWFLLIRGVWGERLALYMDEKITTNYQKEVAISASLVCNKFAIGATHYHNKRDWQTDEQAAMRLLDQASEILPSVKNARVIDIKSGMRPASIDYLPIVGKMPDVAKTFELFPSLLDGTRIDPKRVPIIPNLFVHTAHGGRGFVTAPTTAKMLADQVINGTEIEPQFAPSRFVLKYLRRQKREWIMENLERKWTKN